MVTSQTQDSGIGVSKSNIEMQSFIHLCNILTAKKLFILSKTFHTYSRILCKYTMQTNGSCSNTDHMNIKRLTQSLLRNSDTVLFKICDALVVSFGKNK